ncbi:hypothetical protein DXV75_04035 [Alteromonas aestuariivivens]|uniref:Outer membrane protein beta-barrel domain-containing protein n=1 Tax=Alteromonas aestuariivivens TaxID=1938339 RepID=A0A3D8MD25_9ALTE|nr:hypothetical protein [Alteromonas aestuariivivens]RDV28140.1 hypothetical protein DXV75_04035 [Alteromonas aestuariivivens]
MHRFNALCIALPALLLSLQAGASETIASDYYSYPFLSPQSSYEVEFSFQSSALSKWSFDVQYDEMNPLQSTLWVDSIDDFTLVRSVTLSASRQLSLRLPQRIFASLQTSDSSYSPQTDWIYLPSNAGVAASFGWQFGDAESLKMAVEYKYREVGETDINALLLGVHYFF